MINKPYRSLKFFNFFIGLSLSNYSYGTIESDIKNMIFQNYDKHSLPVINKNDTVDIFYGNEITGLVYFNQKAEQIKFNMITTLIWRDNYLKWNNISEYSNVSYIFIPSNMVWQPDIELYNAGSSPELFELKGQYKLFKNGFIQYIRPTSFAFSCSLSLDKFPFDTQMCSMIFGSWKYPKSTLNLRPINHHELQYLSQNFQIFSDSLRNLKNISVSSTFSHNEWVIDTIDVSHKDKFYLCCPDDLWPNSEFTIYLKRNPNKYVVLIIMSILVTLSSLVISLLNVDNYRRTYVLVFIPLTLIWLQIHVSSKIPVINYPTKLEQIIQLCFYTSIISAFESGILYNFLLNHSYWFEKRVNDNVYIKITNIINKIDVISKNYLYDDKDLVNNPKLYRSVKNIDIVFRLVLSTIFFSFLIYVIVY